MKRFDVGQEQAKQRALESEAEEKRSRQRALAFGGIGSILLVQFAIIAANPKRK